VRGRSAFCRASDRSEDEDEALGGSELVGSTRRTAIFENVQIKGARGGTASRCPREDSPRGWLYRFWQTKNCDVDSFPFGSPIGRFDEGPMESGAWTMIRRVVLFLRRTKVIHDVWSKEVWRPEEILKTL